MSRSGNPRRLPRKASGFVLQPEALGGVPRSRTARRSPRRPGRTERHVVHDSIGRRSDGVQHVRPGRGAADEGHLVLFDGLRRPQHPLSVQDHPPPCRGGEGALVGPHLWIVA